jgi:hypothetical protein
MDWVWWPGVAFVTKDGWDAVRAYWEAQERVTDLGCCHDAGDCAEPSCGRARPAERLRALPAEPINDSRNQDWD